MHASFPQRLNRNWKPGSCSLANNIQVKYVAVEQFKIILPLRKETRFSIQINQ